MQNREWNLIDFHGKFLEDYMKWSVAHPEEAAREEDSDAHYYDMYADWLDTPKDWLGGVSPRGYFAEMQDAPMLVSAFMEYILQEMEVPDPLVERLVAEADTVYPIFLNILMEDAPQEDISPEELQQIRAEILPLIGEMHKPHPYSLHRHAGRTDRGDRAGGGIGRGAYGDGDAVFSADARGLRPRGRICAHGVFGSVFADAGGG